MSDKANRGTLRVTNDRGESITLVPTGAGTWNIATSPTMCWHETDKSLPSALRAFLAPS
jgi:hypothetical protein